MADLVRIKPKAAPYRRAGVAFTSDREFLVFGPADLSPRQLAILAQDAELTIELQVDGKGEDWEPLLPEARASSAEALAHHSDEEWAEIEAAWRAENPIPDAAASAPPKTPRKGRSAAK